MHSFSILIQETIYSVWWLDFLEELVFVGLYSLKSRVHERIDLVLTIDYCFRYFFSMWHWHKIHRIKSRLKVILQKCISIKYAIISTLKKLRLIRASKSQILIWAKLRIYKSASLEVSIILWKPKALHINWTVMIESVKTFCNIIALPLPPSTIYHFLFHFVFVRVILSLACVMNYVNKWLASVAFSDLCTCGRHLMRYRDFLVRLMEKLSVTWWRLLRSLFMKTPT